MVDKLTKYCREGAVIKRILSFAGVLFLFVLMISPAFVPAKAWTDTDRENWYAVLPFNIAVSATGLDDSWIGCPGLTSAVADTYMESTVSFGDDVLVLQNSSIGSYVYCTIMPSFSAKYYDISFDGFAWLEMSDTVGIKVDGSSATMRITWSGFEILENYDAAGTVYGKYCETISGSETVELDADGTYTFSFIDYVNWGTVLTDMRISITVHDPYNSGGVSYIADAVDADALAVREKYFKEHIDGIYVDGYVPEDPRVDFVEWINAAVGAFWDFSIVPGFSIGDVVSALLGVALLIAILRYFAGG